MIQNLLSAKEVALQTGLSLSMVYKLVSAGAIKFIKIGNTYRLRQEAVDEFLKGAGK